LETSTTSCEPYDQFRNFGQEPPSALANIWDDYTASMASLPEDRVHLRIHRGHNCWVVPEEEKYLTPEVLEASCMIGTRDQLIERLGALSAEGLSQVMILPSWDTRTARSSRWRG
jgi:5,10-methylenetetrahydromethanopterin reductase